MILARWAPKGPKKAAPPQLQRDGTTHTMGASVVWGGGHSSQRKVAHVLFEVLAQAASKPLLTWRLNNGKNRTYSLPLVQCRPNHWRTCLWKTSASLNNYSCLVWSPRWSPVKSEISLKQIARLNEKRCSSTFSNIFWTYNWPSWHLITIKHSTPIYSAGNASQLFSGICMDRCMYIDDRT